MSSCGKKIEFFNFYYRSILPIVYDDTLSYYEQLCKMAEKLNEVIASQNCVTEEWAKLQEWIDSQLKEYALDQLQKWLDDGTLEELINKVLFESKVDKTEFEEYKKQVDEQLKNIQEAINDKLPFAPNVIYTDQVCRTFANNARTANNVPYIFQGGCVPYVGMCVALTRTVDETTGEIYKLNWTTGNIDSATLSVPIGHGNGCCYNPNTGEILIVDGVQSNRIIGVNLNSMTVTRTVPVSKNWSWINYDSLQNIYYAGTGAECDTLNENFEVQKTVSLVNKSGAINQTAKVVGDYIFSVKFNPNGIEVNKLSDGSFVKFFQFNPLISNMFAMGEPEWIDFVGDKFYIGINCASGDSATTPYVFRCASFELDTCQMTGTNQVTEGNKAKAYYLSNNANINPRGTADSPFQYLQECIMQGQVNCTGVLIHLQNDIVCNNNIQCGSGTNVTVGDTTSGPSVTFNKNLTVNTMGRLVVKNPLFPVSGNSIIVSQQGSLLLDANNAHDGSIIANNYTVSIGTGAELTGNTKTIQSIFKNPTLNLSCEGALYSSNEDYPLGGTAIADQLCNCNSPDFRKNFYIDIVDLADGQEFTPKWMPNVFYMRFGAETQPVFRPITEGADDEIECTGSDIRDGHLRIKNISFMLEANTHRIYNFQFRTYTDFTSAGTPYVGTCRVLY